MSESLLDVRNVSRVYRIGGLVLGKRLMAVDDVSLTLTGEKPTILSVVGESGSGKTTLARMILRLVEPTSGSIYIEGKSVNDRRNGLSDAAFKRFVQPIFQNPFESFSARKPVDTYLYETALNLGIAANRAAARAVIAEDLAAVGLNIDKVAGKYTNQFSGGELQRISVARALIPRPKLLVADEPVSMIDASLRMNIVNLFKQIKETHNVSFIYITHDLSTAYYVSDYIAIMYRGNLVEYGPSSQILERPAHPYTELLMQSVPTIGEKWTDEIALPDTEAKEYTQLACKFAGRCPYVQPICRAKRPPNVQLDEARRTLCFRPVDYQDVESPAATKSAPIPI